MIKRRFYRLEHGERDSGSDSSSFSSDSEVETDDSTESEDDVAAEVSEDDSLSERNGEDEPSSVSSGPLNADTYSDNDNSDGVDNDADSDNDDEHRERKPMMIVSSRLVHEAPDAEIDNVDEKDLVQDFPDCMIRCKSVFKCRYCPSIICLNEATMQAHVASKKHVRAERLLKQGKIKAVDSDGEVENQEITEGTTSVQEKRKRGSKRLQRQGKRLQRNEKKSSNHGENVEIMQQPKKKKRQTKD